MGIIQLPIFNVLNRSEQYQLLPTQCFHVHNVALKTQTKAQVESKTKGPTLQSPRVHLGCNFSGTIKTQRTCKRKGVPICQSNPARLCLLLSIVSFRVLLTTRHLQLRSIQLRGSRKNMREQLFCLTPGCHENVRTIRSRQKQS